MKRLLLAACLWLMPGAAFAYGTSTFSFAGGGGAWDTANNHGSYTTMQFRVGKITARDRPVQFEVFFGYRNEDTGGHTFHDLDFGIGGRFLPKTPLAYAAGSSLAIRPTASVALGWSIASFDLPMETTLGVALCDNSGGKFGGILFEAVLRPTNEALAKQSNFVGNAGEAGVVDMGPWVGGRMMVFW